MALARARAAVAPPAPQGGGRPIKVRGKNTSTIMPVFLCQLCTTGGPLEETINNSCLCANTFVVDSS